jgi:hypothetical protein
MRAKAHKFEAVVIRLPVNEHEISKASSFLLCRPDFSRL